MRDQIRTALAAWNTVAEAPGRRQETVRVGEAEPESVARRVAEDIRYGRIRDAVKALEEEAGTRNSVVEAYSAPDGHQTRVVHGGGKKILLPDGITFGDLPRKLAGRLASLEERVETALRIIREIVDEVAKERDDIDSTTRNCVLRYLAREAGELGWIRRHVEAFRSREHG